MTNRSCRTPSFLEIGIIKRRTYHRKKCTYHRPIIKRCGRQKQNLALKACFFTALEPGFVKCCSEILVNQGFCKKKLHTHLIRNCIKIGVQLWSGLRDSNPRSLGPKRVLLPFPAAPLRWCSDLPCAVMQWLQGMPNSCPALPGSAFSVVPCRVVGVTVGQHSGYY